MLPAAPCGTGGSTTDGWSAAASVASRNGPAITWSTLTSPVRSPTTRSRGVTSQSAAVLGLGDGAAWAGPVGRPALAGASAGLPPTSRAAPNAITDRAVASGRATGMRTTRGPRSGCGSAIRPPRWFGRRSSHARSTRFPLGPIVSRNRRRIDPQMAGNPGRL
ncbi:hypothetical protein GCM10027080_29500 [Pedococcus soli]